MEITQEILNNFFGVSSLSLFILAMLKLVQVAAPFLFKKQTEQGEEIKEIKMDQKEIKMDQKEIIKEMQINNNNTQIRITILEEQDKTKNLRIEKVENRADKVENRMDKLENRMDKLENLRLK